MSSSVILEWALIAFMVAFTLVALVLVAVLVKENFL